MTLRNEEDPYDRLRIKWREMLIGGSEIDGSDPIIASRLEAIAKEANACWNAMSAEPDGYLWLDLASEANPTQMTRSYRRLLAMAVAYATAKCSLGGNEALLRDIVIGLDWLYDHHYNEKCEMLGNEWDWKMGTPLAYNDIMLLLYDELRQSPQWDPYCAVLERFTKDSSYCGISTGANRTWRCTVAAIYGILSRQAAKLDFAVKELVDPFGAVLVDVTSGDGFYDDGSFIQHYRFPYTGGYGISLLRELSHFIYLFDGTDWEVPGAREEDFCLYRWVSEAYEPLIYKGAMMDMVRGREIAREDFQDHVNGHMAIQAIIRVSQFAPEKIAAAMRSKVKHWIVQDTYRRFLEHAPPPMIPLAREILENSQVSERGELVRHKPYPAMDRVVHLRPGFGFAISMSSSRIDNYESGNNENLRGWYTADGMTYLYNGDLGQFSGEYWPTVNAYRMPGTTVDTLKRREISVDWKKEYTSPCDWVGGTVFGSAYGAAGMHLRASGLRDADGNVLQASSLEARKSWFMFDEEVVALGAGITSTDGRTIETIVENRKLADDGLNRLTVNGIDKPCTTGWSEEMVGIRWIHLEGNTPDAGIGYYFPETANIRGLREARSGAWSEINRFRGSSAPITRHYLTMWFDHGPNPAEATYAYVLIPNKLREQVEEYASRPAVTVLENSPTVQAVRSERLGMVGANYWRDTPTWVQVNGDQYLWSNRKASVMVEETPTDMEIAVSDPTQLNRDTIELQLNLAASAVLFADPGVEVKQLAPTVCLSVNVNGAGGKTFQVKLSKA